MMPEILYKLNLIIDALEIPVLVPQSSMFYIVDANRSYLVATTTSYFKAKEIVCRRKWHKQEILTSEEYHALGYDKTLSMYPNFKF